MPTTRLPAARSARRPATGWQLLGAWMLAMVCLVLALLLPAVPAHAEALPRAIGAHAACAWDEPGRRPFNLDLVAAVARYSDIPRAERTRLQKRMTVHHYDDFVEIRRDRIVGRHRYLPVIRDMLFGDGRRCAEVSRSQWSDKTLARGLVYCEGAYCLLVPTAGRNLSRIQRDDSQGSPAAYAAGATQDSSDTPVPVADALPAPLPAEVLGELVFDPPSAGLPEAGDDSFQAGARPGGWNNPLVVLGGGGYVAGGVGSGSQGGGGSTNGSTGSGGSAGGSGSAGGPSGAGGSGGAPWSDSGGGALPEPTASQLPPVVPAVPEPGTWALMALGLLALVIAQRRRAARH